MNELKPCPFCGSEKVKIEYNDKTVGYNGLDYPVRRRKFSVRCSVCHSRGPTSSGLICAMPHPLDGITKPSWETPNWELRQGAIDAWNKREQEDKQC